MLIILIILIASLALMKIRAYGSKALHAIVNLRGVSKKLNKYIVFTMQTYKKLIKNLLTENRMSYSSRDIPAR